MFPNFETKFLVEEQRRKDEIRQIQLENEYRRAYRDAAVANGRNPQGLRSRFGSIASGLISVIRTMGKPNAGTDLPDQCPDPRLAS